MSTKRITISISQIAPLVGLDAYNNFPRIICEIWRKAYPEDFKVFENKLKLEGIQTATSNEMNDIWEIRKKITAAPFKFSKKDSYQYSLTQLMRDNPLLNVLSAGIRLEKVSF